MTPSKNRSDLLKKIADSEYDLIVIGGGITGAGIALDATSRGLKTLLLEKRDFASGTSSKSTKLIHGGLRYLKQFEIALVREVGMERATVHSLAPHLVKAEKMLLPLIKDGTYGKILTSLGLMVYDVLAGVEKADQRKMLSKEETLEIEPLLKDDILDGGGIYAEYRTDDARLTIEILKTAASHGADILNYAKATDFIYDAEERVEGVSWRDNLSGEEFKSKTKYVINATGPWVDKVRSKDHEVGGKRLRPTMGIHIVVPHEKLPIKHAVYFDEPEGRMLFAIPRDRSTYVGTTDTNYEGDLDELMVKKEDVQYLIDGSNHIFPKSPLKVEDVESTWVGLRPLIEEEGKSASEVSRKDEIFESDSGLLSIAGGKLTGYRKMAERIVNKVAKRAEKEGIKTKPCSTETIVISGGPFKNETEVDSYTQEVSSRLNEHSIGEMANYLVSNYGKQTDEILALFDKADENDPQTRLGLAELAFTLENESTFTLLDFFERRTGRLYFNINSIEQLKMPVALEMKTYFSWDEEKLYSELKSLEEAMHRSSHFV